jgi:ribokinase
MTGRVVVLGSLNVDVVTRVDRHPQPGETLLGEDAGRYAGGKGGNQAMAARRAGAEVVMLGQVGDDDGGAAYRTRLRDAGIETPLPPVTEAPTGTAYITVDEAGENTIIVVPGANAVLGQAALDAITLTPEDVLLASLEVPIPLVEKAIRQASRVGARAVVNLAPYAALDPEAIALAQPVVVNESEMRLLAESGLLPSSLVVTFGAAGARWDGSEVTGVPVPPEQIVDTVGAGDAFCGALAAALASGASQEDALAAANQAGADAVQWVGAQPDARL